MNVSAIAAGAIARAVATASRARENFFIVTSWSRPRGRCCCLSPLQRAGQRLNCSFNGLCVEIRITSDATGPCARTFCALPGAYRLEFGEPGGLHACWEGVCRFNLHTNRVRFFLCTLRAKDRVFGYNYLRQRLLRDMQYLAHSCTKKVLFSPDQLELGMEMLERFRFTSRHRRHRARWFLLEE